jgi:hypothetical protein
VHDGSAVWASLLIYYYCLLIEGQTVTTTSTNSALPRGFSSFSYFALPGFTSVACSTPLPVCRSAWPTTALLPSAPLPASEPA